MATKPPTRMGWKLTVLLFTKMTRVSQGQPVMYCYVTGGCLHPGFFAKTMHQQRHPFGVRHSAGGFRLGFQQQHVRNLSQNNVAGQ